MALTVVKYRKSDGGETTAGTPILIKKAQHQLDKPTIKIEGGGQGLIINKIPAVIKPIMKRSGLGDIEPISKASRLGIADGLPVANVQWQQTIGGPGGTTITSTALAKKQLGAINSNGTRVATPGMMFNAVAHGTTVQMRRPTIFVKREVASIRSVTLELIEKNPMVHLGIMANRMGLLKNVICRMTETTLLDCYITLKKLRQNEDFALLGEYFEMPENEITTVFARTVVKLARYLRFLIRWPDSKKYYDRHKNLPFAFRSELSHVQSLVECVDTELLHPLHLDCCSYKFILCIQPTGIISYISDAFVGNNDDLSIFHASDFQSAIPKYLSMLAVPGKCVRRKRRPKKQNVDDKGTNVDSNTDSADESVDEKSADDSKAYSKYAATHIAANVAADQTMSVVNSKLVSQKVKDFSLPTTWAPDPICRQQVSHIVGCLREFKIMQPCAIKVPLLYQYLSEIIVVCAALTNMQR